MVTESDNEANNEEAADPKKTSSILDRITGPRRQLLEHYAEMLLAGTITGEERMTTQIGSNLFVGWDMCARCGQYFTSCRCPTGPAPSKIIREWNKKWKKATEAAIKMQVCGYCDTSVYKNQEGKWESEKETIIWREYRPWVCFHSVWNPVEGIDDGPCAAAILDMRTTKSDGESCARCFHLADEHQEPER